MARFAGLFRSMGSDPQETEQDREEENPPVSEGGYTLLFVDDEEGVLKALQRIFLDENYEIVLASDAEQALKIMERQTVHLVISDHRMPGKTGAELLKEIKACWPETIRIMLTGYADVQSIMGAVNEGAVYKFITKPWNDEDLRLTVSLALQQYILIQENKKLREITKKQQLELKNYSSLLSESRSILGSILFKAGLLQKEDFIRAMRERFGEEFITETLERLGIAPEVKVARALQQYLKLEFLDLKEVAISLDTARLLPRDLCTKGRILPVRLEKSRLTLAMADPSDIYKCDNIARMTGFKVQPVVAIASEILQKLETLYGDPSLDQELLDGLADLEPIDEIDIVLEDEEADVNVQDLISTSEIPPIIRIVNSIISEAVRYRASDVHIEPKTKYTLIRYRIDGLLYTKIKIPAELHPATISRIKILGKLDIAERRKPQDGRISVKSGTRMVDIRLSIMPTINGEKAVLRILDKSAAIMRLDDLGLSSEDQGKLGSLTKKPQGIIIATGPTGSGKTTLLYSILNEMMQDSKNFETIEDPVEYFLEEASQVYVKEKIGLSFASVLRSTLRQDPDVILVGEVRDYETSDVAFKAALTGHMVLTTLHTNHSIASITRLIDIGIKPYLIASALEGIIAQRLVRRICPHCKTSEKADPHLLDLLKIPAERIGALNFRGRGCPRCNNTGYSGRTGIFEIFAMNDDFRHFICEGYQEAELLEMARAGGMKTLIEDGAEKVMMGETTLDELVRVIGPQIRHERHCDHCDTVIDAKYLFCPYCGKFKQNTCFHCKKPLEPDWVICAFCGMKRNSPERTTGTGGEADEGLRLDRR